MNDNPGFRQGGSRGKASKHDTLLWIKRGEDERCVECVNFIPSKEKNGNDKCGIPDEQLGYYPGITYSDWCRDYKRSNVKLRGAL